MKQQSSPNCQEPEYEESITDVVDPTDFLSIIPIFVFLKSFVQLCWAVSQMVGCGSLTTVDCI